jgi:hypothetical protein
MARYKDGAREAILHLAEPNELRRRVTIWLSSQSEAKGEQ